MEQERMMMAEAVEEREWDEAPEDFEPEDEDDDINYSGLDPAFDDWGSVNAMFV